MRRILIAVRPKDKIRGERNALHRREEAFDLFHSGLGRDALVAPPPQPVVPGLHLLELLSVDPVPRVLLERQALVEALRMSNWVQKDAAELLCISPRVMNYKIKTLGIALPRGRRASNRSAAASAPETRSVWGVGVG